jgi:hypothetical protein
MSDAEIDALLERRRYSVVTNRRTDRPLPGVRIRVTGSTRSVIVTTDQDGLYEVAGVPSDDYKLEVLDLPKTQTAVNSTVKKEELLEKKLVWKDLYLFWNGAIEGRIQGLSGGPAKPWLDIGRADGAIAAEPSPNAWIDDRGTFSFTLLPPGRYTLRINEDGPSDESPYAPQYYPSSPSLGGAHIFEVAEGQQIRNVDLVLRRLYKRNLNVRVT